MELIDLSFCIHRYFGENSAQCNILVIVDALAVLADRLQRSGMNLILSCNDMSTKQWGYTGYITCNKMTLHNKCFKQQLRTLTSSGAYTYHHCCDQNYFSSHHFWNMIIQHVATKIVQIHHHQTYISSNYTCTSYPNARISYPSKFFLPVQFFLLKNGISIMPIHICKVSGYCPISTNFVSLTNVGHIGTRKSVMLI